MREKRPRITRMEDSLEHADTREERPIGVSRQSGEAIRLEALAKIAAIEELLSTTTRSSEQLKQRNAQQILRTTLSWKTASHANMRAERPIGVSRQSGEAIRLKALAANRPVNKLCQFHTFMRQVAAQATHIGGYVTASEISCQRSGEKILTPIVAQLAPRLLRLPHKCLFVSDFPQTAPKLDQQRRQTADH
jgi:hypothetical protein